MSDTEIEIRRQGSLGRITLNRPKAINALTFGMLNAINGALNGWQNAPDVAAVLIDGAGERGLCAGGDIRWLCDNVRAGHTERADEFLATEYRLNARIARFSKPYIAIMDGLVMGGGIGISAHGSVRIVTERTKAAMPEVGIGFLPDVGGTYLLGMAPGELGTHLALTGEIIQASDAILCGLADYHVLSGSIPELVERLGACHDAAGIRECVLRYTTSPAPGKLGINRAWMDSCYAFDTMTEILAALRARPEAAAQDAATRIAGNCPTSLTLALRALRAARQAARLEPCLEQEYRLVVGLIRQPDFSEGVRAAIVDKDRKPAWRPASLADLDATRIESFFRSEASLGLPAS